MSLEATIEALVSDAFCFDRFFAWLVEIVAQFVFHLDLKLDTLGLFAASGIEIKLNNGIKVVSWKSHLHNLWFECRLSVICWGILNCAKAAEIKFSQFMSMYICTLIDWHGLYC